MVLFEIVGCLAVFVVHGMVLYAIHKGKKQFLFPWISQILIELTGALAFGSLFCYNYWAFESIQKKNGFEVKCEKSNNEITKNTLIANTMTTAAYGVFLIYLEVVACSFYYHCVQKENAERRALHKRAYSLNGVRRGAMFEL